MRGALVPIVLSCAMLVGCPGGGDKAPASTTGSLTSTGPIQDTCTTSCATTTGSSTGGSSTTCATACEVTTGPAEPFDPCANDDPLADSCCDIECEPDIDCDIYAQDCPDGEKCVAWVKGVWSGTHCAAVDPNPKAVGEPCTVQKRGIKLDDCEEGAICWNVPVDSMIGVCVAQCTGTADAPMCPPGDACVGTSNLSLKLCLPSCDPLQQDCPSMGEACYPANGTFVCATDASGDGGAQGDPCAFINVCDAGLACVNLLGCDACCSAFCQLDAAYTTEDPPSPKCPDPAMGCVAWYKPGEAPPGRENVGVCLVP